MAVIGEWSWERRAQEYVRTVDRNEWIPFNPHPRQRQFLILSDVREILFGGAARGGKALSLDTPVPTPTGWTTMGAVQVGDEVFGPDGSVCRVVYHSGVQHGRDCYLVKFSDGSETIADAEHLWHTFTHKEREQVTRLSPEFRERRRATRPSKVGGKKSALFTASVAERNRSREYAYKEPPAGGIRTTAEIASSLTARHGTHANHAIPLAGSLNLPPADLPLDPYLLGVWLGDGSTSAGTITSADPDIPEAFRAAGFVVKKYKDKYGWGVNGLVPFLRQIGVFGNKHVPDAYLRGSREQRLALLQGLMDTDGYACKRGQLEFCNTNIRLAKAVFELAASLGHKPHFRTGVAKLNGREIGPKYIVKWMAPDPAFRLKRKLARQKVAGFSPVVYWRHIVSCDPTPSVPVCCIKVDREDGLFLHGRAMIPTHNTAAALMAAAQYVDVPGYSALILRENFADLQQSGGFIPLSKDWWYKKRMPSGGQADWNESQKTWTFPSGATIKFGYMERDDDVYQYAGGEYCTIIVDEVVQHTEWRYRFLFSRLTPKVEGPVSEVPLRMRATANPGGKHHNWVKNRFIDPKTRERKAVFIPSKVADNPSVDKERYVESLSYLDPITRAQLLDGDWDAVEGGRFNRNWFKYYRRDGAFVIIKDAAGNVVERFIPQQRPVWQTYDPSASGSPTADQYCVSTWCLSPLANLVWLGCHTDRQDVPDQLDTVKRLYRRWNPQFIAVEEVLNQRSHAQLLRRSTDPVMVVTGVNPGGKKKAERSIPSIHLVGSGRLYLPEDDRSFPLEDVEGELLRFTGEDGGEDARADSLFYSVQMLNHVQQFTGASPGSKTSPCFHDPTRATQISLTDYAKQRAFAAGNTPKTIARR